MLWREYLNEGERHRGFKVFMKVSGVAALRLWQRRVALRLQGFGEGEQCRGFNTLSDVAA
jgi:hypothetical protein